jgi:hypothetical protein
MEWLKQIHILCMLGPWPIAIWARQAWIIILCLAIHLIVITQWAALRNHCALNIIENEGRTDESEFAIQASEYFNIPLEELKQGFILVNGLAPNFLHLSRLAGALGL